MNHSNSTIELSADSIEEAIAWRRRLHRYPELSFQEHQTSAFIASQLERFGFKVHTGLAGTGVVGSLVRGTSRRSIGIRADMDALPIQEQGAVSYASCHPGVMHACGHDGHVAIALAAARVCAALPDLDGTLHFIFQPAEENEGGGRRMVEDGLFKLFPCDAVYALHNWPALPLGSCAALDGPMMAALGTFEITVSGRGCHGAMPHEGTDAILAGAQLVGALQSIVSRNIEPLRAGVVSVTQIRAGDTFNVIPEKCVIRGTTRWFDEAIGNLIERRVGELSRGIAGAFECNAHVHYEKRFPATINDARSAQFVRELARSEPLSFKVEAARPTMGSEDFAYMLQAVPGCYLWLGAGRANDNHGLHSSRYDFNDEALLPGALLWVTLVRRSLSAS